MDRCKCFHLFLVVKVVKFSYVAYAISIRPILSLSVNHPFPTLKVLEWNRLKTTHP